ncbi:hypothetical protein [Sorangium sp. So ce1335]|uniref:hypothetical protein n=1 Tax=Sorangium sp. So ce1335 TaxID=3133335 RepID=UPI003F5EEA41
MAGSPGPVSPCSTPEARLLDLADRLAGSGGRTRLLAETMRVHPEVSGRRPSTLNDDGSPLELCITSTRSGCRYRIIGDPEPEERGCRARLALFRDALARLLPLTSATRLAPVLDAAVDLWLPEDDASLELITSRILWLAAAIDTPGVGIYLDGRVGSYLESLERGRAWLDRMLPDASLAKRFLSAFDAVGGLGGVGVEGVTPALSRVKVQWGVVAPILLDRLGLPLLGDEPLRRFFHIMAGDRELRVTYPVFSAGFALESGALADVKVDICGCRACLALSPEEWVHRIEAACAAFGLAPPPVLPEILARAATAVFLGLGLDAAGEVRLNLYLKG